MKLTVLRAVISTLLLLAFILLVFSGALLYFAKTGVVWGVPRYVLRSLHICAAAAMCVCAPVHLIINRRQYLAELRASRKTVV